MLSDSLHQLAHLALRAGDGVVVIGAAVLGLRDRLPSDVGTGIIYAGFGLCTISFLVGIAAVLAR